MENDEFKAKSKEKFARLDRRALGIIEKLMAADIPRGKKKEILLDIKERYDAEGNLSFLTEKQRELIRSIERDYDDYEYHHELCTRLAGFLEDGSAPYKAENFIRSVVEWFNEKHFVTPLQLEQMIRIIQQVEAVASGENPGDDGAP